MNSIEEFSHALQRIIADPALCILEWAQRESLLPPPILDKKKSSFTHLL
jgi:hypothetical protein